MNSGYEVALGIVFIALALAGIALAVACLGKNRKGSKFLAITCFAASLIDISYFISIISTNYFVVSLLSSIYFSSIDIMVLSFFRYMLAYTENTRKKIFIVFYHIGLFCMVCDVVSLMMNPFKERVVHYVQRDTVIARFDYEMYPAFDLHLAFVYCILVLALVLLFKQLFTVPREYRNQYRIIILGIFAIVGVNAIFLFLPGEHIWNLIDVSIFAYNFIIFVVYWTSFQYATHGMLNGFKTVIFENIDQGLVLFDYNNDLILSNQKAKQLVSTVEFNDKLTLTDFISKCDLALDVDTVSDSRSMQCYIDKKSLRCDYSLFKNEQNKILGRLFVFTDAALDTDLLTGFHEWESFEIFVKNNPDSFKVPTCAVIFDINSLGVINSRFGRTEGDRRLSNLAAEMREYFPKGTYFVRGHDAHLIALVHTSDEKLINKYTSRIDEDVQCAFDITTVQNPDITAAILGAAKALRNKKLMDSSSSHSELISSLVRALEACDVDTKEHVQRTQVMGGRLAERLRLTDVQKSQLTLLCLLHDIGKIAIPLEILNKPGKLDPDEFKIIKSHTEKGYQIAKSSRELADIADTILHHHERWDGNGYPDGLSKESIPLLSRIISVVDAYDAMTNDRVYRPAMRKSAAIEELRKCAGTQFDPSIVSEFIQILGSIEDEDVAPQKAPEVHEEKKREPTSNRVHSFDGVRFTLDDKLEVVSIDDRAREVANVPETLPFAITELIPEEERLEFVSLLNSQLANGEFVRIEHSIIGLDGNPFSVLTTGRMSFDTVKKRNRFIMFSTLIMSTNIIDKVRESEHEKANQRMERWENKYRSDSLTGILNHAAFTNDVEDKLISGKNRVLMLMLDVDHFKEYNDTYGHQKGDELLIFLANTLKNAVRDTDICGRLGGDEFAMVLLFEPEHTDKFIYERAEQVFSIVRASLADFPNPVSISMGAAISNENINTFSKLYDSVDRALYSSKETGRDRLTKKET